MLGDCVTDIRESALKKMELARLSEVGVLGHVSFLSCVFYSSVLFGVLSRLSF